MNEIDTALHPGDVADEATVRSAAQRRTIGFAPHR